MRGLAMTVAEFAALGLPTNAGFVAELLVFLGTFQKYEVWTILAVVDIAFLASYILWMFGRVLHAPPTGQWEHLGDAIHCLERIPVGAPLAVILGLNPQQLIDVIAPSVRTVVARLG